MFRFANQKQGTTVSLVCKLIANIILFLMQLHEMSTLIKFLKNSFQNLGF